GRRDVDAIEDRIDGQGFGAGNWRRGDEPAGLEIVRAKLRARDDVEPVACPAVGQLRVVSPRFDEGVADRDAQIARPADPVFAPGHQAAGHDVFGEMWMGPLVDVGRDPVAPVLEEFRRGTAVVDLVEVHLVGLGQAEDPEPQDRYDEDDDEPCIEAVEPPTRLTDELARTIGPHRAIEEPAPEPGPRTGLAERPPL